jgi:hypothetical protein
MRRLTRPGPSAVVTQALNRGRAAIAAGVDVSVAWSQFSRSAAYDQCRRELGIVAGARVRCFYCSDSLGVELDHYWPKIAYPGRAFDFGNLMLVCGACNRRKGSRFPLDGLGRPLLIDPTLDDPWDVLFFDEVTGLLIPRVTPGPVQGEYVSNQRGVTVHEILGEVLNRDAVCQGRVLSWHDLVRLLQEWCVSPTTAALFYSALEGRDQFGLGEWMLHREGAEAEDVRAARAQHEEAWRLLRDHQSARREADG